MYCTSCGQPIKKWFRHIRYNPENGREMGVMVEGCTTSYCYGRPAKPVSEVFEREPLSVRIHQKLLSIAQSVGRRLASKADRSGFNS